MKNSELVRASSERLLSEAAHMAPGAVGKHHALANLFGEFDHLAAERCERNGRHLAGARCVAHIVHELSNITKWLTLGYTEPIHCWRMADPYAKAEAPARQLMNR